MKSEHGGGGSKKAEHGGRLCTWSLVEVPKAYSIRTELRLRVVRSILVTLFV